MPAAVSLPRSRAASVQITTIRLVYLSRFVKPPMTAPILLPFRELVKVVHGQPLPTNTGQPNPVRVAEDARVSLGGKFRPVIIDEDRETEE